MSEPSAARPSPTGYVTDVAYPRAFVPSIAPPTLRLVAALNGLAAPPEDDFDYCELGPAAGDTLTTVAAANPDARFVGVELSAEHVRIGRERARRGEVSNVNILERDFEDLREELRDDVLPMFDIIVAHGIWSWVSPGKREAALNFVQAKLKQGGLFYVSYNALPGWAAVEPLRRLMLDHTRDGQYASTLDRARDGRDFAQRMADSGAAYFGSQPTARSMLALMQKGGLPYVVHEYFHADWQPMYFADVARSLATADLSFVGQFPLYANVRELAIPPSLKKTAELVQDRTVLEGLRDFATNELFRSDVYVKGKPGRSAAETRYFFEGTPFGTMAPAAAVRREARFPFYTLEYKDPIYDAVLGVIARRPTSAMQLALTSEPRAVRPDAHRRLPAQPHPRRPGRADAPAHDRQRSGGAGRRRRAASSDEVRRARPRRGARRAGAARPGVAGDGGRRARLDSRGALPAPRHRRDAHRCLLR